MGDTFFNVFDVHLRPGGPVSDLSSLVTTSPRVRTTMGTRPGPSGETADPLNGEVRETFRSIG